eukprot:TRINITY_DN1169_c0_g1_i7.p1 TRINITY_DN1169_c0_g1~~TRINITY_DN1169_c0_g1_i7.p1  ORF type:complete len:564 (-),score=128.34 TRINITY_DN1169_c0_g1_i7:122-1813(-)
MSALFARISLRGARRLATHGVPNYPPIQNDHFRHYAPGSVERDELKAALAELRGTMESGTPPDVPCIVDGEPVFTRDTVDQVAPSDHAKVIARVHQAPPELTRAAIASALEARDAWARTPFEDRAAVLLKAGDLVAGKYRAKICAATMLGQGKTAWQAEIDAGVEAVDFLRYAPHFAEKLYGIQPTAHAPGTWNRMEYLPLEGFVFAVAPFNFSAIFVNLPASPVLMGNVCLVKPSHASSLSNFYLMEALMEAGLPPGVVNFLPGDGPAMGNVVFKDPNFAGLHFTGSTAVFEHMWGEIGRNIGTYRSYPRIVGETGGKNAHFVGLTADVEQVAVATVRAAFEYQGQKCSACSRMYVPAPLWPAVKERMRELIAGIRQGQPDDLSTFMSAVIDRPAYERCRQAIADAGEAVVIGGGCDDSVGFMVEPTVIETADPRSATMETELFGPVLTVYVYEPENLDETIELCDTTSKYALTGAIFAQDTNEIVKLREGLRHTAGNAYVNGPSTGSVVNQQPFGGGRKSGTNDKSGSMLNLLRWVNARTVKVQNTPLGSSIGYPSMEPEK